jgi:anti-sigma factor RsiW
MTDARDFDLELDMLSAYLDGELTDAERLAVEERLEVSAEWRAELAEVESVRAIVRGLPTRDAPPGFWDRVLAHVEAEAESEVEVPTADVAPPVPITAARGTRRGTRSSRGRAVTWFAGAAAAVAAVVVVVALPGQHTVKPNVTAVATQHGASASNSGDPISGLAPMGVASGPRR